MRAQDGHHRADQLAREPLQLARRQLGGVLFYLFCFVLEWGGFEFGVFFYWRVLCV